MKTRWVMLVLLLNLAIIGGAVIVFLTKSYPFVGHDYRLAIPSILDCFLHYRVNGLGIEWYTPSFGGGLPVYPNPNYGTFSLVVLLTYLFSAWQSVIVSTLVYLVIGGVCGFYFFRKVLVLGWTSGILGTVFFTATGFYMERIAVGHLGYQAFPLVAIFLIVFFDSSLPIWVAGLVAAVLVTVLIHSGGYSLFIMMAFSLLLLFPLIYIFRPTLISWKRVLIVLAGGGVVALIMSASKLTAVYSFMRFFPRQVADTYQTTTLKGLLSIVMQLAGEMNLAPLIALIGGKLEYLRGYMIALSGGSYGYWEFDMSMTPVALVIILAGAYQFIRKPKSRAAWFTANRKWVAWLLLAIFTWITLESILAKGLIYPFLQKLPIFSSMHVNMRFTAAFILPLALVAAIIYDHWSSRWSGRKVWLTFMVVDLIALLPLGIYLISKTDLQERIYNVAKSDTIYAEIRSGDPMIITGIASDISNTDAMLLHESNLQPYEPIFGYFLEDFHPEIHAGSVWDVSDGYYNMTNPSGYVFPEINNSRPFERIPVSQQAELLAFTKHEQPDWKIPVYQQVLDWVSGLTFLVVVCVLLAYGVIKLVGKIRARRSDNL